MLDIAQDHQLDTAEYIARCKLGFIAYRKGDYDRSVAYFTQARQMPAARHYQGMLTRELTQEMELASAARMLQTGNLPDNVCRRLQVLAQDTNLLLKTEALKLLALQEGKIISRYIPLLPCNSGTALSTGNCTNTTPGHPAKRPFGKRNIRS